VSKESFHSRKHVQVEIDTTQFLQGKDAYHIRLVRGKSDRLVPDLGRSDHLVEGHVGQKEVPPGPTRNDIVVTAVSECPTPNRLHVENLRALHDQSGPDRQVLPVGKLASAVLSR
jgi:hypothetical protein